MLLQAIEPKLVAPNSQSCAARPEDKRVPSGSSNGPPLSPKQASSPNLSSASGCGSQAQIMFWVRPFQAVLHFLLLNGR